MHGTFPSRYFHSRWTQLRHGTAAHIPSDRRRTPLRLQLTLRVEKQRQNPPTRVWSRSPARTVQELKPTREHRHLLPTDKRSSHNHHTTPTATAARPCAAPPHENSAGRRAESTLRTERRPTDEHSARCADWRQPPIPRMGSIVATARRGSIRMLGTVLLNAGRALWLRSLSKCSENKKKSRLLEKTF